MEIRRELTLGRSHHAGMAAHLRPPGDRLTNANPYLRPERRTRGAWNPGDPAHQPGYSHGHFGTPVSPQPPAGRIRE
jgi:hypothetical protein